MTEDMMEDFYVLIREISYDKTTYDRRQELLNQVCVEHKKLRDAFDTATDKFFVPNHDWTPEQVKFFFVGLFGNTNTAFMSYNKLKNLRDFVLTTMEENRKLKELVK